MFLCVELMCDFVTSILKRKTSRIDGEFAIQESNSG